ncbi:MAG: hypothetical protein ACRDHU_11505 [Actinomycetota bacterium]
MRPSRITLVPHTHWDREWYEPFDVFLGRLVSMMDTLLDLGNRGFPHFHLDGQTAMVDDYLAVRPEREPDVRRLASEGRLSLGPWVTQMDEFLTSGESHVRNLEMGLARARELATATEIGYLPDQFGHIGQMPQILRQAGIERAVVWRGVPRAVDRSAFWWEAPDGSGVTTEYLAFGYSLGHDLRRYEDAASLADALRRKVDQVAPFLAGDRMLITVGSDHAGPDASLPERLAAAEPLLDGMSARVGSLLDHLDRDDPADLPVWRGELRSSARAHLLPNVYSARIDQKRERGRVEALIERYAEPLAALVPGFAWPAKRLERAWTLLLWNGAHDSACGCSHDRVARDVDARNVEADAIGASIADEALRALGRRLHDAGVLRFNPSPFERDGIPGLGWRVEPRPPEPGREPTEIAVRDGWVETGGGVAFTLRDEPDVGDLYNFCPAEPGRTPAPPSMLEADGDRVRARWNGLDVRIRAERRRGEAFLRLEGEIRNERPDHRLRLHVRLAEEATGSIAGAPFELVARGLRSEGGNVEAPSQTWPARGVVVAGGIAVLQEGVFEYEVTGRELAITLLRCVGTISRESIATRPWPAGPGVPTPGAQMIGTTEFAIGVRPAPGDDVLRDWERFALPLRTARAVGGGSLPEAGTLLGVAGDAALSSVRRHEDSVEVRLWNASAARPAPAVVDGREIELGPARIETIRLGESRS